MNTRNSLYAAQAALLEKGGGGFSLAEAAMALNISPQAMHAQIDAGRALGVIQGDQIVVPRLQLRSRRGQSEVIPGIDRVVRIFRGTWAGAWATLQFLIEPDPNLGTTPIVAPRRQD